MPRDATMGEGMACRDKASKIPIKPINRPTTLRVESNIVSSGVTRGSNDAVPGSFTRRGLRDAATDALFVVVHSSQPAGQVTGRRPHHGVFMPRLAHNGSERRETVFNIGPWLIATQILLKHQLGIASKLIKRIPACTHEEQDQRESIDVSLFIVFVVSHDFWWHIAPTSHTSCHPVVLGHLAPQGGPSPHLHMHGALPRLIQKPGLHLHRSGDSEVRDLHPLVIV
mmetsp:Transcript_26401/g.73786  ORF Transcript_26401/g.73786 Transcript_26401/m.73786 type:complete len:226 (+) Transcript_26401:444-1121(+)